MRRLAELALLVLPPLLYLFMPSRNFYWDGVAFAIDIEKHPPIAVLLHPSHLLYAVWGAWLYRLVESVGIHARALFILQAANGVLAGGCVLLLYKLLQSKKVPACFAIAGALLFGFSATWWRFAADANAYVPSIFLLLCATLLLESKRPILAAFAHAAAMLFHELAILFLPVAWLRGKKYSATALLPVATAYIWAYQAVSRNRPTAGFFSWITAHSPDSGFSFGFVTDAILTIRGTFRLLFGGKPEIAPGLVLLPICAACIVFLWRARQDLSASRFQSPPWLLMVWITVYVAFLFFWMPQNTFYRLFYLPPLIALLIVPLDCTSKVRNALCSFTALVALWNFLFVAYPQSRPESNVPLRFAMAQQQRWPPGTPIVFRRFHPDLWTISYFNQQAAWITLEQVDLGQLNRDLDYARRENTPLWLEATAYDLVASDAAGRHWLTAHERPAELLDFADTKHRFTFHSMR